MDFYQKTSTIINVLTCNFDWVTYFNDRQAVYIYIDYDKAFDKLSRPKLLYKLAKLGLGGELIRWI